MRQTLAVLALGLSLALAQGKITVWTHFGGPELEWLKEQARTFERTSGTKVEVVEVPFGEIKQKFILGAPQGQAADLVVTVPHDWVGEMAQAGVLEPVGKYVTQTYLADLQGVAVEAFTFGGEAFRPARLRRERGPHLQQEVREGTPQDLGGVFGLGAKAHHGGYLRLPLQHRRPGLPCKGQEDGCISLS